MFADRALLMLAAFSFLFFVGCDSSPSGDGNADADADADATPDGDTIGDADSGTPYTPVAPTPPAAPVLTPCPDGWETVDDAGDHGVAICEPLPSDGPSECPDGQVRFIGEQECAVVGAACASDGWPRDLPAEATVYFVRAGAPAGGTGTRDAPFATIGEAVAVASPGSIVALATGTYAETVELSEGVTLAGACAEETVVQCVEATEELATVEVVGDDVAVRDLSLVGPCPGVIVREGAALSLSGVVIEEVMAAGVVVRAGADAVLDTVVVRGTSLRPSDHLGGVALATLQADVTVTRAIFEGNRIAGVTAARSPGKLVLNDVIVRDTSGGRDGSWGRGLDVAFSGDVEVNRSLIESSREAGVVAQGEGTRLSLSHVVIRDTLGRDNDGAFGGGVQIFDGAEAHFAKVLLARNRESGALISEEATTLEAEDLMVVDTEPQRSDDLFGRGLDVQAGATVTVTRALFDGNHDIGVHMLDDGTMLTMTDVVVRQTLPRESDGSSGRGLEAVGEGHLDVQRATFEGNREVGVLVVGGAALFEDLSIRDMLPGVEEYAVGYGLEVIEGAQAELLRGAFESNQGISVLAFDPGTTLQAEELLVQGTAQNDLGIGGNGVVSANGALVTVQRFLVGDNALCGVQLAKGTDVDGTAYSLGGEADFSDGEISDNVVGVNVQTEGFDVDRLTQGVTFRGNQRNIDMDLLPVPPVVDLSDL